MRNFSELEGDVGCFPYPTPATHIHTKVKILQRQDGGFCWRTRHHGVY